MNTYAPIRSLHRRGIHTVVASEYDRLPHFASRYCDEHVKLDAPPEDLLGYRDGLLEVAARPDVETIVPVREFDAFLLAKYRDAFEAEVDLVSPDLPTLRRAQDRLQLAREAEAAGVPYAETRLLSAVEEWDGRFVVKPRYNLLTNEYVDSFPPGEAALVKDVQFVSPGESPDVESIRARMRHDPIVQAFVPQERKHLYTALWNHGEPVVTYQHQQIRQDSWVGGGGIYRVSTHSAEVEELAARLLGRLDWHGFACIEYVKDSETGEWKFLEINPRIWQSMPEAVRAGVDFPHYFWLVAHGYPEVVHSSYEPGIACHNAYGEVRHLLSILRDDSPFVERPSFLGTAGDIVTSCIRHPRFEYIRLDDPKLFLAALRETLSTGVRNSRQFDAGDEEAQKTAESPAATEQ
jgi:predicted ATP-grasp superfamily ATP-dependent carboligase